MIRVLLVDDHDLFRTGLATMLADEIDVEVVGQASRGRDGMRLAAEIAPDVVLMDLRTPDISGITAIEQVLAQRPDARVLALSVAPDRDDVTAALRAGACGFLAKDTPVEGVVAAVRAAASGAAWLSPPAAQVVLDLIRSDGAAAGPLPEPERRLSRRELDVLRLVAHGLENDAIAAQLHISPMTVKNHVSSILGKLGLPSRVQAAVYAVRSGLLDD